MAQNFDIQIQELISNVIAIIDNSRQINQMAERVSSVITNNPDLIAAITNDYLQDESRPEFNHLTVAILAAAFTTITTNIIPAITTSQDEFDKVKV